MTHKPLARRAASEARTTAHPSHHDPPFLGPAWLASSELGVQLLSLPNNMLQPPTLQGQGSCGNSRVNSGYVKVGGPAATPIKNTKKKKKKKISV